jgi:DNA-binding response OmpR family regulator
MRILMVEDDPDLGEAIRAVLVGVGHDVAVATRWKEALSLLRSHLRPDLMLIDYQLPDGFGCDLVDACRSDCQLQTIPAIMMSATRPAGLTPLPASFLPKPFATEELLARIAWVAEKGSDGPASTASEQPTRDVATADRRSL